MIYQIIAIALIACLAGRRKPLYGGLAGFVLAPSMSVIFSSFDVPTVLVLASFGFCFGYLCAKITWWIISGSEEKQHTSKPYVMPITRAGGGQRGEIIYTDEEEKNAKENKDPIE